MKKKLGHNLKQPKHTDQLQLIDPYKYECGCQAFCSPKKKTKKIAKALSASKVIGLNQLFAGPLEWMHLGFLVNNELRKQKAKRANAKM